ncbi:MAG: LysR family transcriptional regulator [Rhizobiales bacterium]|nr:LysR family transcriptional regulator [Hyphomicrobiales bacterium]
MLLSRRLMPSMQELVAFEAAGRHGNFTKAAEELALTQSAVSKQVSKLEETLGVVLFDRSKGRLVLTKPGQAYLGEMRQVLASFEGATYSVIASSGAGDMLDLAVLPTFASRWLIPRLPKFQASHAGVTINITTEAKPFDFSEKPADVAIHYGAPNWPHAEMTYLCDEAVVAVASPDYVARLGLTEAGDLLGATLLQMATRPNLWEHWFAMTGVVHPHPYRGPLMDQFASTLEAAAAGMGVALVPTFLVERELSEGQLRVLFGRPLPGTGAYYAVVPLDKRHEPLPAAFVAWLVEEAASSARARRAMNGALDETR